jgi:Heterokaryon incompatibility protein (HET)
MTSYIRTGCNIYNSVEAPVYNVLSYTWGYYQDNTKQQLPLLVHGVDWPIPPIQKDHFTAASFRDAIKCAARGVNCPCEWLWVDIACIPQKHNSETKEAASLRGQEIGRQVEIFQRAKEAFAWLSSLKTTDILDEHTPPISVENLLAHINKADNGLHSLDIVAATEWLDNLDNDSRTFGKWMDKVLHHPWFKSLWTLQEMVLRSDAWILFDDGLLRLDEDSEVALVRPWNFSRVKFDIFTLRSIISGRTRKFIDDAEALIDQSPADAVGPKKIRISLDGILLRLRQLLALQELKGLDALDIKFPHTAYSIAQNRRVTNPEDRVYGIVQTYGISCSLFPPGDDAESRLHALEDEFGIKLVAKSPVLSQLFIHSSTDEKPRRSWLITQKCKVDDPFWMSFTSDWRRTNNLFNSFEACQEDAEDGTQSLYLSFIGKAWSLETFVESSSPSSALPAFQKKLLFSPHEPGRPQNYRGLMLDHHISKIILGHVVDYFDDREGCSRAVQRLHEYYGRDIRYYDHTSSRAKVALLGSSSAPNLPVVDYVGVVLAPCFKSTLPLTYQDISNLKDREHFSTWKTTAWKRIGLIRWTEIYSGSNHALHYHLPLPHNFQCKVI